MTTYYAFLIKRPIDREPWPTIFVDLERAEAYEHRVSEVVLVTFGARKETGSAHD